jgi:hypothetical protein
VLTSRIILSLVLAALLSPTAFAQSPAAAPPSEMPKPQQPSEMPKSNSSLVCVPGTLIEAWSEGAWYLAVALDPLRDGRCFVHYENYGSENDEALPPKNVRSRR